MALQDITDARTIALLFENHTFACLERLMQQECTVGGLARALDLSVGSTFYRVQQLLEAGLIEISRETRRAGRPLRHYRATASGYRVPFAHTSSETVEQLWWQVLGPLHRQMLQQVLAHRQALNLPLEAGGILLQQDPSGGVSIRFDLALPEPAQVPMGRAVAWLSWESLQLSHQDARALQAELQAVLERYRNREGEPYTLQLGLVSDRDFP